MRNVKTTIKGSKMTVEIDLDAPATTSTSGKSEVFATTGGGKPQVGVDEKGEAIYLSLTAYRQPGR